MLGGGGKCPPSLRPWPQLMYLISVNYEIKLDHGYLYIIIELKNHLNIFVWGSSKTK